MTILTSGRHVYFSSALQLVRLQQYSHLSVFGRAPSDGDIPLVGTPKLAWACHRLLPRAPKLLTRTSIFVAVALLQGASLPLTREKYEVTQERNRYTKLNPPCLLKKRLVYAKTFSPRQRTSIYRTLFKTSSSRPSPLNQSRHVWVHDGEQERIT